MTVPDQTDRAAPPQTFGRGDVVLVKFVFADEQGAKRRPGLIVSSDRYRHGRHEAILVAITSNISRLLVGDYRIKGWRPVGLLHPSIVTGIVRTIKQDMIADRVGTLAPAALRAVEAHLRDILAL